MVKHHAKSAFKYKKGTNVGIVAVRNFDWLFYLTGQVWCRVVLSYIVVILLMKMFLSISCIYSFQYHFCPYTVTIHLDINTLYLRLNEALAIFISFRTENRICFFVQDRSSVLILLCVSKLDIAVFFVVFMNCTVIISDCRRANVFEIQFPRNTNSDVSC